MAGASIDYTTLESCMHALATWDDLISAAQCGRPGATENLRARIYVMIDEDDSLLEVAEILRAKMLTWIAELRSERASDGKIT